jgi:hypothetical protein
MSKFFVDFGVFVLKWQKKSLAFTKDFQKNLNSKHFIIPRPANSNFLFVNKEPFAE